MTGVTLLISALIKVEGGSAPADTWSHDCSSRSTTSDMAQQCSFASAIAVLFIDIIYVILQANPACSVMLCDEPGQIFVADRMIEYHRIQRIRYR